MTQDMNKKRFILSVVGLLALIACIGGVAYAFFNYVRTGSSNTIRVGRITFDSSQSNAILLTNFVPISSAEVSTETSNVGIGTVRITGDTEYDEGIEYLVKAVDVHNTIVSGSTEKTIPISIIVSYEETTGKTIGEEDNDYFNNRGGNSSIYKLINGDTITENGNLLVGYIAKGQTGIDGVITIKAFVDEDRIVVSNYDTGETDKVALTIEEWNNLKGDNALSFKIQVEANTGVWVENNVPTPTITPVPTPTKPIICKIASTLNSTKCNSGSSLGCRKSGYSAGATIEYGSIVDSLTYDAGDAFDCNVDGTGFNQRFYYLRTLDNKAVLISNNNYEGVNGQQNDNNFIYSEAISKLPTYETQWTNVPTTFTYNNTVYAARFPTMDDLKAAAKTDAITEELSLNGVQFLYENIGKYATANGRSTVWLEEVVSGNTTLRYRYHVNYISVVAIAAGEIDSSKNCVRPVIEVPLDQMEQFTPPSSYPVHFYDGETLITTIDVDTGTTIGSDMPNNPSKNNYIFSGWYDSTNYATATAVTAETTVNEEIHAYAKWKPSIMLATVSPSSITMAIGSSTQINVTEVTDMESYTFTSSDTSVAMVSSTGVVSAIAEGTATITIRGTESNSTKTVSVTVNASAPTVHTVTLNVDGGTLPQGASSTVTVNHGSAVGNLPTPTKTDYLFDGWYLVDQANHTSSYNTFIDSTHQVIGDEEYIANWIFDNYEAAIGSTYYATLVGSNSAIANLSTSGQTTIRLLKDVTITSAITLSSNHNLVMDLNGHTLTNTSGTVFDNSGKLEIVGGTVKTSGGSSVPTINNKVSTSELRITSGSVESTIQNAIINNGKLYITGGKISTTAEQGCINNNSGATLEMTGGEIVNVKRQAIYNDKGTVTISGDAYLHSTSDSATRAVLQNQSGGTMTILSGRIISVGSGGVKNAGTLTIGTIDNAHNSSLPFIQGAGASGTGDNDQRGYGVYSTTNYSFYDGVLRGTVGATNNESRIANKESSVNRVAGTDTVDSTTYNYLYYELASGNTVTYNANGGSVTPQSKVVSDNTAIGSVPIPTRADYIFEGWYLSTDSNFQNNLGTNQISYVPTGDVTIVANWVQSVSLANIANTSRTIVGTGNTDTIVVSNAGDIESFTYSSDNPFIATVNSSGTVTATGVGRTLISLTGSQSGNKKVISVTVDLDNDVKTFDIMPEAMRVYFDNIDDWASGQTDSNHTTFDTYMGNNLSSYNCVNFNGDDRNNKNTTTGSVFCDQPNQYDTGETGTIKVYEYDYNNSTRGSEATYVTNDNGKLYNFIPGRVYEWEKDGTSTNGKVYIYGERRIITINNSPSDTFYQIRNVRDLGGIKVDTDGDGTIDGTLKYGKLYRGEKVWTGTGAGASSANTLSLFTKLGINHEMDLRAYNEPVTSEETTIGTLILNSDNPSTYKTYEVKHYEIDYTNDATYYALARKAVIDVMTEYVNAYEASVLNGTPDDYSLYFHCRIGSDRTGMLAYLLEGLLGATNDEQYRDYEMSVFFGIDERTRFYYNKGSNTKKFVYMKNAIKAADLNGEENVMSWFLKGSTNVSSDTDLVNRFRTAMIDYY